MTSTSGAWKTTSCTCPRKALQDGSFAGRSLSWQEPGASPSCETFCPASYTDELWARYLQDPAGFVAGWRILAQEMRQGFVQHARQRLTSLTRLQQADSGVEVPAWQEIQRALDGQQNDLLRAAFAMELLEMVEPAVLRATHLRGMRGCSAQLRGGGPLS